MFQTEKMLLKQPFGVNRIGKKVQFSFVSKKQDCGIVLYDVNTGEEKERVPFRHKVGNVYYQVLDETQLETAAYSFSLIVTFVSLYPSRFLLLIYNNNSDALFSLYNLQLSLSYIAYLIYYTYL